MNCELNETGLVLPREMLTECQLADISLNAHLCSSALVLLPERMSAGELVGAWESLRKVNGALFDALLAACRSDCGECCGDHTVEGVSELLLTLLIDNGGCPASLADHIRQEDVVYG